MKHIYNNHHHLKNFFSSSGGSTYTYTYIFYNFNGDGKMINIDVDRKKQRCILEYYDKNKQYNKQVHKLSKLFASSKKYTNKKPIKKVTDIYTKKEKFCYKGNSKFSKGIPIPYIIKHTQEGYPIYDYSLANKLINYDKIIEKGLSFPRTVTYDIETMGLDPEFDMITSIAWIDNYTGEKFTALNEDNEYNCLYEFISYLKKNKIMGLVGFNSNDFDDQFLQKRLRINDIYYNVYKSCNIDVMKAANKLFINGSLMSMCEQLGVDDGKIDLQGDNPIKLYQEKRYDELLHYNLQDVVATNEVIKKLDIFNFYEALFNLTWTDFKNIPYNSNLNNCFFNRRIFEDNFYVSRCNLQYKGNFGGGYNYYL